MAVTGMNNGNADERLSLPARDLRFPTDRSLGELFIREGVHRADDYAFWQSIGRAQGSIAVEADKELRLNVNPQASTDLSSFRAVPAHAIQYLQLSASRVNNDSLTHLAHLTGPARAVAVRYAHQRRRPGASAKPERTAGAQSAQHAGQSRRHRRASGKAAEV